MIILDAQGKTPRILFKQPLNVIAKGCFPCVADAEVENQRGRGNDHDKSRHHLNEDAVSHLAASNL